MVVSDYFHICQVNKPKSVSSVSPSRLCPRIWSRPSSLRPGGAEWSWGPGGPLCLRCPAGETSSRWTRRIQWSCRSLSPTSRCKRTPDPRPHPGTRPPDAASEDSSPEQQKHLFIQVNVSMNYGSPVTPGKETKPMKSYEWQKWWIKIQSQKYEDKLQGQMCDF